MHEQLTGLNRIFEDLSRQEAHLLDVVLRRHPVRQRRWLAHAAQCEPCTSPPSSPRVFEKASDLEIEVDGAPNQTSGDKKQCDLDASKVILQILAALTPLECT